MASADAILLETNFTSRVVSAFLDPSSFYKHSRFTSYYHHQLVCHQQISAVAAEFLIILRASPVMYSSGRISIVPPLPLHVWIAL